MTPLGEYSVKPDSEGIATVTPREFITVNWPVLCEICGLALPVRLNITSEDNSDDRSLFYGMRTGVRHRHHEVWLSPRELNKDLLGLYRTNGLVIAGLWSGPTVMLRLILTYEGIIPRDQYIDADTALYGDMGEAFITSIREHIEAGEPKDEEEYHTLFDAWVAYYGMYKYMGVRDWDSPVEPEHLAKIIRAEKDLIVPGYFV